LSHGWLGCHIRALSGVTALVLAWALPRSHPTGLTVAEAEEEEVFGAAGVEIPERLRMAE
jgi:hypothetical protein